MDDKEYSGLLEGEEDYKWAAKKEKKVSLNNDYCN